MNQPPRRGLHALASMLPKVTKPIFAQRGFAEAGILTDWPAIVGSHLAAHTMPEKISFPRGARTAGTLHVVTESAFAPELQHLEPQVIERINGFFGYYAVGRLRIQHGRVVAAKSAPPRPAKPRGAAAVDEAARTAAATIEDAPLRASLERLGTAVRRRGGSDGPVGRPGPNKGAGKA